MINLPNGCRCSESKDYPGELPVHPSKWKEPSAGKVSKWYITYRFWDQDDKVIQVTMHRMNIFKDYQTKKEITETLMGETLADLHNGYNPITQKTIAPINLEYEIPPETPFIKAIDKAQDKIQRGPSLKASIKSMVNIVSVAARELSLGAIPIGQIKRRHIKQLLERCRKNRNLSPQSYNHYRAYMMMLFKELLEMDAIESDPVSNIRKEPVIKKLRLILTPKEREIVHEKLKHPKWHNFRRYLNLFYHAGSRTSELFRMQVKDVHLDTQYFKITIIKGNQRREVLKPIKDVAVKYWTEAIAEGEPDDYIFCKGLKPGKKPLRPDRIPKIWSQIFTDKDGNRIVNASFYSIKHSHAQEVEMLLGIEAAKKHMSHTSISTTEIYTGKATKDDSELKSLQNEF